MRALFGQVWDDPAPLFTSVQKLTVLAIHLWCLGLFFITFDRALVLEVKGMTVKLSYFLFLGSFCLTIRSLVLSDGIRNYWNRTPKRVQFFVYAPLAAILLYVAIHGLLLSMYKFKSIVYGLWLWFDIICVVLPPMAFSHLLQRLSVQFGRGFFVKTVLGYLVVSILILGFITAFDYVAYFFGDDLRFGVLGFSQTDLVHYIWPRPHAYSFEPSYIAMYFGLVLSIIFPSIVGPKEIRFGHQWIKLIAVLLGIVALGMYFSRSALAYTFLLGLAIYFIFIRRKIISFKQLLIHAVSLLLLVGILAALMPKKERDHLYMTMVTRLSTGVDGSFQARWSGVNESLAVSRKFGGYGVGLGNSYLHTRVIGDRSKLIEEDFGKQSIQSIWFEVLAELGLFGVSLLMLFIICFSICLLRARVREPLDIYRLVALASFVLFFLFEAHFLPNICRTDMWAFIGFWSFFAFGELRSTS